jgi:hypothetical protein
MADEDAEERSAGADGAMRPHRHFFSPGDR